MIGIDFVHALADNELLASARRLVDQDNAAAADLLVHLGEIDARRLYLGRAFSSMFAFCLGELGFSEDVAYNRIAVARATRRFPMILELLESDHKADTDEVSVPPQRRPRRSAGAGNDHAT